MRIGVIGALVVLTLYATWYMATALVYWWLLVVPPDRAGRMRRVLEAWFPAATEEIDRFWATAPRTTAASIEAAFRRGWPWGICVVAVLAVIPIGLLAVLWWVVLAWAR